MIPNDLYVRILESIPVCCVDVVLIHRGKVLLVCRNENPAKNQWWLPGGRLLKGETFVEAAKRKAKQELGLDVEVDRKIGSYEVMFNEAPFPEIKSGIHEVAVCFVVRTSGDVSISLDETSGKYRWVDRIDEGLHGYVKQVLVDASVLS